MEHLPHQSVFHIVPGQCQPNSLLTLKERKEPFSINNHLLYFLDLIAYLYFGRRRTFLCLILDPNLAFYTDIPWYWGHLSQILFMICSAAVLYLFCIFKIILMYSGYCICIHSCQLLQMLRLSRHWKWVIGSKVCTDWAWTNNGTIPWPVIDLGQGLRDMYVPVLEFKFKWDFDRTTALNLAFAYTPSKFKYLSQNYYWYNKCRISCNPRILLKGNI